MGRIAGSAWASTSAWVWAGVVLVGFRPVLVPSLSGLVGPGCWDTLELELGTGRIAIGVVEVTGVGLLGNVVSAPAPLYVSSSLACDDIAARGSTASSFM